MVLILEVLVPPVPNEEHLEADLALVLLGRQPLGRVVALAAVEGHQVAPHHTQVAQDGLVADGALRHGDPEVGPMMRAIVRGLNSRAMRRPKFPTLSVQNFTSPIPMLLLEYRGVQKSHL